MCPALRREPNINLKGFHAQSPTTDVVVSNRSFMKKERDPNLPKFDHAILPCECAKHRASMRRNARFRTIFRRRTLNFQSPISHELLETAFNILQRTLVKPRNGMRVRE